jgi:uncharacterized protein (DUF2336 family)
MAGDKAEHRRVLKNDPIRAGRKALDIAQLCTLRPLPDPVIQEFDTPLVTLLQAAEGTIRTKVALRLAGCSWAPREAVRMLAFEPLEISEPVLARSPVITEDDLLTLAREDADHRLLIARRPRVSEPVSAAIAKYREADSLMALARNEGAELSDRSAVDFAAIAKADESLQTALSKRTDMGAALARAIYAIAGEAVKQSLLAAYPDLAPAQVEVAVDEAVENPAESDTDAGALTETLERDGALTKADVLRAARNGRSDIADHAVARLTGLPAVDWRRALSRSPLRVCLLAGRAMAMTPEEACALYIAFADIGRAHAVTPDALGKASAQVYRQFARDDARHALHRLGAGGSIA